MAPKDITKQQRDRFLAFSFASADLFLETDAKGKILYALGAAKGLTGIDDQTLIGKNWLQLFSKKDHSLLIKMQDGATTALRCGPVIAAMDEEEIGTRKAIVTAIKMPNSDNFYITLGLTNTMMEELADLMGDNPNGVMTTGFTASDINDAIITTGFEAEDDQNSSINTGFGDTEADKNNGITTGFLAEDENISTLTTSPSSDENNNGAIETDFAEEDEDNTSLTTDMSGEDEDQNALTTPLSEQDSENAAAITADIPDTESQASAITTNFTAEEQEESESKFNKADFIGDAEKHFDIAKQNNQDAELTVLDFDKTKTIPEENWADITSEISKFLRENAINGSAAAEIGKGQYSILHGSNITAEAIQNKIAEIIKSHDPSETGVEVASKTILTNQETSSSKQAARSLFYTINEFEEKGTKTEIVSLEDGFSKLVTNNYNKIEELEGIIERVDFDVNFQPIVNMKTRNLDHYEVLSRFKTGTTQDWVMFGEDTGLAAQLDVAVVERTMNYIHYKAGTTRVQFSVNVSCKSLEAPDFLENLEEQLSKRDHSNRIIFELTDATKIEEFSKVNHFIQRLKNNGYPVALDDFGGDEKSLKQLDLIDIDYVKIDGRHTLSLTESNTREESVRKLVETCKTKGIKVIGEFIEDKEQVNLLSGMGVALGQGYLFSKPLSRPDYLPPVT